MASMTTRSPRTNHTTTSDSPSQVTHLTLDVDEQEQLLDSPTPTRIRTVHHWARVWLGKISHNEGRFYTNWTEEAGETEVSVQTYGEPRWIEMLMADMIIVAKDILKEIDPEYGTVRLRVNLFTHQADGKNHKFTLEHLERR